MNSNVEKLESISPALYILGYLYGIDGLVYAQPVADVAAITLAVILYRKASKKFFPKEVI